MFRRVRGRERIFLQAAIQLATRSFWVVTVYARTRLVRKRVNEWSFESWNIIAVQARPGSEKKHFFRVTGEFITNGQETQKWNWHDFCFQNGKTFFHTCDFPLWLSRKINDCKRNWIVTPIVHLLDIQPRYRDCTTPKIADCAHRRERRFPCLLGRSIEPQSHS